MFGSAAVPLSDYPSYCTISDSHRHLHIPHLIMSHLLFSLPCSTLLCLLINQELLRCKVLELRESESRLSGTDMQLESAQMQAR